MSQQKYKLTNRQCLNSGAIYKNKKGTESKEVDARAQPVQPCLARSSLSFETRWTHLSDEVGILTSRFKHFSAHKTCQEAIWETLNLLTCVRTVVAMRQQIVTIWIFIVTKKLSIKHKSYIQETLNLLTCADSSTNR